MKKKNKNNLKTNKNRLIACLVLDEKYCEIWFLKAIIEEKMQNFDKAIEMYIN